MEIGVSYNLVVASSDPNEFSVSYNFVVAVFSLLFIVLLVTIGGIVKSGCLVE